MQGGWHTRPTENLPPSPARRIAQPQPIGTTTHIAGRSAAARVARGAARGRPTGGPARCTQGRRQSARRQGRRRQGRWRLQGRRGLCKKATSSGSRGESWLLAVEAVEAFRIASPNDDYWMISSPLQCTASVSGLGTVSIHGFFTSYRTVPVAPLLVPARRTPRVVGSAAQRPPYTLHRRVLPCVPCPPCCGRWACRPGARAGRAVSGRGEFGMRVNWFAVGAVRGYKEKIFTGSPRFRASTGAILLRLPPLRRQPREVNGRRKRPLRDPRRRHRAPFGAHDIQQRVRTPEPVRRHRDEWRRHE